MTYISMGSMYSKLYVIIETLNLFWSKIIIVWENEGPWQQLMFIIHTKNYEINYIKCERTKQ